MTTNADPSAMRCPSKNVSSTRSRETARLVATIPASHPIEAVLSANYFGNVIDVMDLRVRDIIELEWEDDTKFGELSIRSVEKSVQQVVTAVRFLNEYEPPEFPEGWSAEFRSAAVGWVLKFHGNEVEANFRTSEEAATRASSLDRQKIITAAIGRAKPTRVRSVEIDGEVAPERQKPGRKPKVEADAMKVEG